ncbi:hypothetical protein [Aurantibacillus circumpalustris]|uniref:hypothetical protein n=1 Tax=Aurantibacillus circumpalustris TaxID=3036359 RepID=UPI00295BA0E2|nr:hypothetical protein [Aurantibacillus circumpalustris]
MENRAIKSNTNDKVFDKLWANIKLNEKKEKTEHKNHITDISFSDFREFGVKVEYKSEAIEKYFLFEFELGTSFPRTISDEEILIEFLEWSYFNEDRSYGEYLEYRKSPYISKKLYDEVSVLLDVKNIALNKLTIGTIAISFLKFKYEMKRYEFNKKLFTSKKESLEKIKYLEFLTQFQQTNCRIDKIKIQATSSEGSLDCLLPLEMFEAYLNKFEIECNDSIDIYRQCIEYEYVNVQQNKTENSYKNRLIGNFVGGLDSMLLSEFKITTPNHRHFIIGYLLSYSGVIYSELKVKKMIDNEEINYSNVGEYLSDRARQYIPKIKDSPH